MIKNEKHDIQRLNQLTVWLLLSIISITFVHMKLTNTKYIAKEIDCKNRDFFWQNNMESNNTHGTIPLIWWDKIYRPKHEVA